MEVLQSMVPGRFIGKDTREFSLQPRVPGIGTVKGAWTIYNEGYLGVLQPRVPGSITVKSIHSDGYRTIFSEGYPRVLQSRKPGNLTAKGM